MNRREFLSIAVISVLSGKELYDTFKWAYFNQNLEQVYHLLPENVYRFTTESKVKLSADSGEIDVTGKGVGIFYDGHFITMAHILCDGNIQQRTPFGIMNVPGSLEKQTTYLDTGEILEPVRVCHEEDVAIFKAEKEFPDFPYPKGEHYLGQDVYIIGNPGLKGSNVRRSRVSDFDGVDDDPKHTNGCFGLENTAIGGDSGSPVVSLERKLLGLVRSTVNGFAYVKEIGYYNYTAD